jgi:SAM-dependent methyltransferase
MIDTDKIRLVRPIIREKIIFDRDKKILEFVEGKSVFHVGCVGTFENGLSFHNSIKMHTSNCVGVDINEEGLDNLKINDPNLTLILGDVCEEVFVKKIDDKFDYCLMGEVVEHLQNPGIAIRNIKLLLKEEGKILITVPNAFSITNYFYNLVKKGEMVRTDHVAYYSFQTLNRLVENEGLKLEYFNYYTHLNCKNYISSKIRNLVKKVLFRARPNLSDGIFAIYRL